MAVEIKELVIRAIAEPAREQDVSATGDTPEPVDQRALVEACVKEVLRILKKSQER